jgi:hypothetical protein
MVADEPTPLVALMAADLLHAQIGGVGHNNSTRYAIVGAIAFQIF